MADEPMKMVGDGDRLFRAFRHAQGNVERLERELSRARSELEEVKKEFGKWMCPKDAKPDETFSIWFGDSLISVKLQSRMPDQFSITPRQRGKSWDEAACT